MDKNAGMLDEARRRLSGLPVDLVVADLTDPLPAGPFDLVVTALAVHHLDGPGKAELFARVAAALRPGGRFVLGDVVVPADPADAVTPLTAGYDQPWGWTSSWAGCARPGSAPSRRLEPERRPGGGWQPTARRRSPGLYRWSHHRRGCPRAEEALHRALGLTDDEFEAVGRSSVARPTTWSSPSMP